MSFIDLRSDTVTLPTDEMRRAMANAELGDDVFGEDPTVNRLQERAAEVLGKEAGLLVTSGTQGNMVALMAQARPGEEAIVEEASHVYNNESAGISRLAGLIPRPLQGRHGILTGQQIEDALRPHDVHFPRTSIVCLENTHNAAGGTITNVAQTQDVAEVARKGGMKVHIDGARIFNAAVGLRISAAELAAETDSLTFCLSKGLSCPAGSVVVGSDKFIEEARRARKVLGGGMRQAGVLAAAGLVALDTMIDRLAEDHAHAQLLGKGVSEIEALQIDLGTVQTNIVIFDVGRLGVTSDEFAAALGKRGLGVTTKGVKRVRCVTHYGIETEHVESALQIIRENAEAMEGSRR